MRLKPQPIERAMDFISVVLPTPGTSSINTCPPQRTAMSVRRTASCLPTMTFSTFAITRLAVWLSSCIESAGRSSITLQIGRPFRRLRSLGLRFGSVPVLRARGDLLSLFFAAILRRPYTQQNVWGRRDSAALLSHFGVSHHITGVIAEPLIYATPPTRVALWIRIISGGFRQKQQADSCVGWL